MSRVPFEQVLDIIKQKNRRIELIKKKKKPTVKGGNFPKGWDSPPLYETLTVISESQQSLVEYL